jgi:hypothetical protein
MKRLLFISVFFAVASVAHAIDKGNSSASVQPSPANTIFYVPGSIQKVCQVTGDTDFQFRQPTVSLTQTRYGLVRADHGYSFEHDGKIFFLFGDTHPTPKFNGKPDSQTDPPRTPDGNDAIGYMSDSSSAPCARLDFLTDSIGAYENPMVLNDQGQPVVRLRTNESPVAGISDGGRMYVMFSTDNPIDTVGPPAPLGHPARSVMAVSDDDGNTFHYLYSFSKEPAAKFVQTGIARGLDGYIYFWGTQDDTMYRKSPVYLARKPAGKLADSTAIEYLNAVKPDGSPVFLPGEENATPLFHDSIPGPGNTMVVADGMSEVGVEWNPYVQGWVMLYNCLNDTPEHPRGIYMRFAERPWGPWSQPQTIFNPNRDDGYCFFMHRAVTSQNPEPCDSLSAPDRMSDPGGDYGPYFISRFTTGDVSTATSTFYFTMDTWNPYTQVIMKATIQRLPLADTTGIPRPKGIYVVNEASNLQSAKTAYVSGLTSSPAYTNVVGGHAIFIPIAKILPSITTWGEFNWDWGYVDSLVDIALAHGKKFSIELETGYQTTSTYLHSLPAGFLAAVGPDAAPLFDVWTTGGTGGRGISAYIPLPWVPRIQEFWSAAAYALAAHLQQTGAYNALTLVHLPGLSVYDEELRLPTGRPSPTPADTELCPDGRPAYPTVITDADTSRWRALGYSDSAVVHGFTVIASAFAQAFPDRFLGLSLFPLGPKGIDFPNLTGDTVGTVAAEIVQGVTSVAPGRVQIQADNLDANVDETEVLSLATRNLDFIGWQSNRHGGTGAGCDGGNAGSCNPDGPDGPYFGLLKYGSQIGGEYMEVWSNDVVSYPQSFAAAQAAGIFVVTDVAAAPEEMPTTFSLEQNYPNPFNPTTLIKYTIGGNRGEGIEVSEVSLDVYDILGRKVATLVHERKAAGSYEVNFDGSRLASGMYIYRLTAGVFVQSRKMLLLK